MFKMQATLNVGNHTNFGFAGCGWYDDIIIVSVPSFGMMHPAA